MKAGWRGLGIVAAACLCLGGCVVPARDDAAFRTNATQALESATSEARTAQLALQQWLDGGMPRAYADVVVTHSEGALGPIQSSFGGVDPPNRAVDSVREEVTSKLSDAESALALARIALRRGDRAGVEKSIESLDEVASGLEQAGKGLG